ncbi:hypothetical protein Tco_0242030 [Tanacetum coccineum]
MASSDYVNSDPVPPQDKNVFSCHQKNQIRHVRLEFLFSPLLEEYYNPTHGQAEENNNDQAPNASFQEAEFINPFCTRVIFPDRQNSHPLEQVRGNPTMPVQTRRQLATDPEMCMFALTKGSIVEPKNIKEAMADSTWIEAMQDNIIIVDRLKSEKGSLMPNHPEKSTILMEKLVGLKSSLQEPGNTMKLSNYPDVQSDLISMSMLVKDIRSQDGKDDKDNDKGSKSRSQSMKEQDYNEDKDQEHSSLNDKSNLTDLMKECHQ